MADSGGSSSVISLPKGGGALHGIGEKFSPDLHTGTGNFTVPISIPPGRNGFQPQLNLVYSTGNGNGPFGLGWSLSIPGVTRKTFKGIPRYRDGSTNIEDQDVFILSGAEDLVPVSTLAVSPTRYRPRTEGLFALIEHHFDASSDFWEVRSKDGLTSRYGTADKIGQDPAVVADPSSAVQSHICAWKLTSTVDPFENRIEYEYERDNGQVGPHQWDQVYLKRIRYADYDDNGQVAFLVWVTFDYEDREDAFSEYRSGFEIRTTKRCTRVTVSTHADQDRLVRTYDFIYLDKRPNLVALLPLNGASLLSQVIVTGYDGAKTESLPPLEFGYTQFQPSKDPWKPFQSTGLPATSLASNDLELVDLFGQGLPDFLEMSGIVRYWRNLGDGKFDFPRTMTSAPAGVALSDAGVQLIDANGNGRTDLLVTTAMLSGYYPLRFGGLWDSLSFRPYPLAPSFNLKDQQVKLVDLDGDGVTDAIRCGTGLECFFNHPTKGWYRTLPVNRNALDQFPVSFSDPHVKWGDMSGDGLHDIVMVQDGSVVYWPNLGYGKWGKRITMLHNPDLPFNYEPKQILVGDIDGDGLADIVYVDSNKVTAWINQGGNRWSDPILVSGYYFPTTRLDVALAAPPAIPVLGDLMRYTVSAVFARLLLGRTVKAMFAPQPVPPDFLPILVREMLVRPAQIRANAEDAAFMIPAATGLRKRYRELTVPVTIFAGEADKIVEPDTHARRLHAELSNSELHVFPGLGHMLHYAVPEQLVAAVATTQTRLGGSLERQGDRLVAELGVIT